MAPTLLSLVQEYFPSDQWDKAQCILAHECQVPMGEPCAVAVGPYECGSVTGDGIAYGPFGLLDLCWDPALNPDSPFSREAWCAVMDPNVNVWMASVIWSMYGWIAWTTCPQCGPCDTTPGGAIPHPERPLTWLSPDGIPKCPTPFPWLIVAAAVVAVALIWRKVRR